jgi:hypothetical protein
MIANVFSTEMFLSKGVTNAGGRPFKLIWESSTVKHLWTKILIFAKWTVLEGPFHLLGAANNFYLHKTAKQFE